MARVNLGRSRGAERFLKVGEVEVADRLQRLGGGAVLEVLWQGFQPGGIVTLQGDQLGDSVAPTLGATAVGTLALAVFSAWASPFASGRQVLTFRTRARSDFAPPTCRMPLGQSSG